MWLPCVVSLLAWSDRCIWWFLVVNDVQITKLQRYYGISDMREWIRWMDYLKIA
jgi:hypothetical protein